MTRTEQKDTEAGAEPELETRHAPRWAPVLGIAVALLVLALFVFLHLSGTLGSGSH